MVGFQRQPIKTTHEDDKNNTGNDCGSLQSTLVTLQEVSKKYHVWNNLVYPSLDLFDKQYSRNWSLTFEIWDWLEEEAKEDQEGISHNTSTTTTTTCPLSSLVQRNKFSLLLNSAIHNQSTLLFRMYSSLLTVQSRIKAMKTCGKSMLQQSIKLRNVEMVRWVMSLYEETGVMVTSDFDLGLFLRVAREETSVQVDNNGDGRDPMVVMELVEQFVEKMNSRRVFTPKVLFQKLYK